MLSNGASLIPFAPELVLSLGILTLLALAFRARPSQRAALPLTLATVVGSTVATLLTAAERPRALFGGLLARDSYGDFFKLLFAPAAVLVALACARAADLGSAPGAGSGDAREDRQGVELGALLLATLLGAQLMAAATDLLLAYLALEFVSLLSYVLTGLDRGRRRSAEAALKYAIYGGVASGAMLYGFSLLYGLARSTDFAAVRAALAAGGMPAPTVALALAACLAGLGFKMAVVPFHMWCPDVYEGAPTPVAAFFSVVPKAAGFALASRFLAGGTDPAAGAAAAAGRLLTGSGPATTWALVVVTISAATMTLGNFGALGQTNIKRLLAYSSIAHAGTILMALSAGTAAGSQALLTYLGIYLFMNLAAFLVVVVVAAGGVGETLADFVGLGRRAPVAAFCLAVALFSLTGLPPTAGFVAKYAVFAAVVRRGLDGGGAPFLALGALGVANTVVSLYYYARVVRAMYLVRAPEELPPLRLGPFHLALLSLTTLPVLLLGIYTAPLADLAARSTASWAGR